MALWSPPRRPAGPVRPHVLHRGRTRCAPATVATTVRRGDAPVALRRTALTTTAAPRPPASTPPATGHPGLAAVATVGGPALWVAALAQVPAGTVRGLVLAAGWVGLASVLDRPGRRRAR